jgi:hypothetical protein
MFAPALPYAQSPAHAHAAGGYVSEALHKMRDRIRQLARRTRGRSLELNRLLPIAYFDRFGVPRFS